jgi:heat-inducible transcriptional repressor
MSELDHILDTASKLASSLTNYTGIAIKPRALSVTMSKFELVLIDDKNFAMVMITSSGVVKTKKVKSPAAYDHAALTALSELLNSNLCGMVADTITLPIIMNLENEMGDNAFLVNPAIKAVYEVMNELDGGELKYSGLNHLLAYPEYSDTEHLGNLLGTLEEQKDILDLVSEPERDDINVLIGSESSVKEMNNSSLVFKPIKKNGKTVCMIGVLGPRRMDYARVVATIDELAGNVESILNEGNAIPEKNGGHTDG